VSIAQYTFGVEGKVGVALGAGLTISLWLGLDALGLYTDKLSTCCGGTIIVVVVNSETTATSINVNLVSLLFPMNWQRKRPVISEFRQLTL
jgi:hypothetical protein